MRTLARAIAALALGALTCAPAAALTLTELPIQPDPAGPVRFYTLGVPDSFCPGNPAVVVLHGGGQSMRTILEPTSAPSRWLQIAEDNGLALIIPNGFNTALQSGATDQQTWNDLRPQDQTGISKEDDAGFIAAVVEREAARLGFSPDAVFVTGSSNGGIMTYRMLVERPDLFAAGAAFIANLPEADFPDPPAARPVMICNGEDDPSMPTCGGGVGLAGAPVRSTLATADYWRALHGLPAGPAEDALLPDIDPTDNARILRTAFLDPAGGPPPVVLYRALRAGHVIPVLPEDPQTPLGPLIGSRCRDARGVDLAWSFFLSHAPAPAAAVDLDGSGAVDYLDLAVYLDRLDAGLASADLDCDGQLLASDVLLFLALAELEWPQDILGPPLSGPAGAAQLTIRKKYIRR